MLNNRCKKGFTLIELLVVVLIIGILAAIALPQYKKAVERSRASEALTVLKALAQAGEAYYLATGSYPLKFDELSVSMPSYTGNQAAITGTWFKDTRSNDYWSLQMWFSDETARQHCIYMTPWKGKYTRSTLCYCFEQTGGQLPVKQLACQQREATAPYCQEIMKGKPWPGNDKAYTLN